jgi:hypothetical protein
MANESKANKPLKVIRCRGVSASVFENSNGDSKKPFYKVSLQKTYKDGDDFKTTTSFGRDDLASIAMIAQHTWLYISELEEQES